MFCYLSNDLFSNSLFTWVLVHPTIEFAKQADVLPNLFQPQGPLLSCCNQDSRQTNSQIPKCSQSQPTVQNYFKLQPDLCRQKRKKGQREEEQFKPNAHEVKKIRKTAQNSNRNVVPNIMHQVISFLQKRSKSEKLLSQIVEKLGMKKVSVNRFYLYQMLIKQKLNNYVNAQSLLILNELQEPLCEVYSKEEQMRYNQLSRVLVQQFLKKQFNLIILTSKRVHADKKGDHLTMKRKIVEQIMEMFQK